MCGHPHLILTCFPCVWVDIVYNKGWLARRWSCEQSIDWELRDTATNDSWFNTSSSTLFTPVSLAQLHSFTALQ